MFTKTCAGSMRRSRRSASGSAISDRASALLGLFVTLVVGGAAALACWIALPIAILDVDSKSNDVAAAIAQLIADDFDRAVDVGIPLAEMRGVEAYLVQILSHSPEIRSVSIRDSQERVLFTTRGAETGIEAPHARAPIVSAAEGDAVVGTVVVHASGAAHRSAQRAIVAAVAATALLAGLVVAFIFRVVRLERADLPKVRTVAALRAIGRGRFTTGAAPQGDVLRNVADAANRITAMIHLTHRRIQALADEIRAVDGSGETRARLTAITGRMAGLQFARRRRRAQATGAVWWPVLVLTVLMASRPLVANFAYDRIGDDPFADLSISVAVAAQALGAMLGLALALACGGRWSKLATFVATLITAVSLGAVYLIRDYLVFAGVIALANAAAWFGVWTVLQSVGAARRAPWRAALILLAAGAIGPLLGSLLAEAEGRRLAFAIIGAATLVVALLSLSDAPRRPRPFRTPTPVRASEALALVAASLAASGWLDVHLAGVELREQYAFIGLNFGLCGVATLIPIIAQVRLPAAVGAALAALAMLAAADAGDVPLLRELPGDALHLLTSALVGLGFGIVVHALGARGLVPVTGFCLAVGVLLAGGLNALSLLDGGTGFPSTALAATALAALAVAAGLARRRRRAA